MKHGGGHCYPWWVVWALLMLCWVMALAAHR